MRDAKSRKYIKDIKIWGKDFATRNNRYLFVVLMIVLLSIYVVLIQYEIYQREKFESNRFSARIDIQLHKHYDSCKKRNLLISQCNEEIIDMVKLLSFFSQYNDIVKITNSKEDVIWKKEVDNIDTIALKSNIVISLPDSYDYDFIDIKQNITLDKVLFFQEVVRKMTFSMQEFFQAINDIQYANQDGQIQIISKNQNYIYYKIESKTMCLSNLYDIKFKDDQVVKKGDVLATGNLNVAIKNFINIYWPRSRTVFVYCMQILAILFLLRKQIII